MSECFFYLGWRAHRLVHVSDGGSSGPDGLWIFDPRRVWRVAYQCCCFRLVLVASTLEPESLISGLWFLFAVVKATLFSTYHVWATCVLWHACSNKAEGGSRGRFWVALAAVQGLRPQTGSIAVQFVHGFKSKERWLASCIPQSLRSSSSITAPAAPSPPLSIVILSWLWLAIKLLPPHKSLFFLIPSGSDSIWKSRSTTACSHQYWQMWISCLWNVFPSFGVQIFPQQFKSKRLLRNRGGTWRPMKRQLVPLRDSAKGHHRHKGREMKWDRKLREVGVEEGEWQEGRRWWINYSSHGRQEEIESGEFDLI